VDVFGFHDSGHRDQHVHVGKSGQDVGRGGGDRHRVCGVDDDGVDSGLFGGDLCE